MLCSFCLEYHPNSTGDDLTWSPIVSSNITIADGKGAVSRRRFSKLVVPNRTRIGDLTRAVTREGQDIPARRRVMQLRKRGEEEGGGGKHPAVHEWLNLQPQGHRWERA